VSGDNLDTCGCCQGLTAQTPVTPGNAPGLSAVAYRVGTHGQFKASMLAALSGRRELDGLTTRADYDPAIALLDGWAAVLDVLSFYQERIANECYLRTATERRSILELARAIGYELRPGVTASTHLAFTLDDAPQAPLEATIPAGAKVQSVPGPDEKPQTFETVEELYARAEWNALRPRLRELKLPGFGGTQVTLRGTGTNLKPGDALLLVGTEREGKATLENWDFRRVKSVEPKFTGNADTDYTVVTWERPLGQLHPYGPVAARPRVFALRQRAALFGANAPDWQAMPDEVRDRYDTDLEVGFFRRRSLAERDDWPGLTIQEISGTSDPVVFLDAIYPKIQAGGWLVLSQPEYAELYQIESVTEDSRSQFTLTAKTSRLVLKGEKLFEQFNARVRETVAFGESDELFISEQPRTDAVAGQTIELETGAAAFAKGRKVIVSGQPVIAGVKQAGTTCELAEIDAANPGAGGRTTLVLKAPLARRYDRDSVRILGNVAPATHGESQSEVLGSSDARQPFQKFALQQAPLTYVSAANAGGAATTLEVRVNDVAWTELPSLQGAGPHDRGYVVRRADDGKVTVEFGDGLTGAAPPTGLENLRAAYRVGLGLAGNLKPGQLSQLLTRPLGVKGATNPLPATGGDDPEPRDQARRNAPRTVLTLDRIVSLQDFEDFARAFAGIGKAQASWIWTGARRVVFVTVAGPDGGTLIETQPPLSHLLPAMAAAREPTQPAEVGVFAPRPFRISAKVLLQEGYLADAVYAAVTQALLDVFGFERRSFGQAVTASEVLAAMQAVEGVRAADLDALHFTGAAAKGNPRLPSNIARWDDQRRRIQPAELLTLAAPDIELKEMRG
jgi:hypothetical protein